MQFKSWQVIRLRDRLDEYRVDERDDAKERLSIAALLARMQNFATPPAKGISTKTTLSLQDEALRRFAKGPKNFLSSGHLNILKDFLIHEGYLSEADLEYESKHHADLFKAQSLFANQSPAARQRLTMLAEGSYRANPDPTDSDSNVELLITHDPEATFVHVTERDHLRRHLPEERGSAGRLAYRPKIIRSGFGFLSTDRNLLHILLVGAAANDRVHYLELVGFGDQCSPHLLRIGGHDLRLPFSLPDRDLLSACNIFAYQYKGEAINEAQFPDWNRLTQGPFSDRSTMTSGNKLGSRLPYPLDAAQAAASDADLLLFRAVQSSSESFIEQFIAQGANPNYQDADGMTALHHAAAMGSRAAIRALVKSGKCDYLLDDNEGRSAAQLASEMAQDFAVARLLTKRRIAQARALGVSPWKR